jgi:peptidoglycan/xylan/chitin deacetylase (PgdA/CDA1 family)
MTGIEPNTAPVLFHGCDPAQVALTFDDGPNDPHTFRILEALAKHDAKATFFLLGKYLRKRPDIARAIHAAGHTIGNHPENHPWLENLPSEKVIEELELCKQAIEDAIGLHPTLFRPPFGSGHNTPRVPLIAQQMGMETVMWSVIPADWQATSAGMIVLRVSEAIDCSPKGNIVLLHDGGHESFGTDRHYTVGATRKILQRYAASGKKFISVQKLKRD